MTAAVCALSCALIILGTFIKIPLPMISITLQLEFVLLSAMLLGAWRSSLSVYYPRSLRRARVHLRRGNRLRAQAVIRIYNRLPCRVRSHGIHSRASKGAHILEALLRRYGRYRDNIYYRYCIFLFYHPALSQYISGLHEDDERLRVHDIPERCRVLLAARVHRKAGLSRNKKVYHLLTIE